GHFDRQKGQCTYTPKAGALLLKASLREFDECAGAMGQAPAFRRETMFVVGAHLAKGSVETFRLKHRIITETGGAARRPDQRAVDAAFEFFQMPVGPGDAQGGDEMRTPVGSLLLA